MCRRNNLGLVLVWSVILAPFSNLAWAAPQVTEETLNKRRDSVSKLPESKRQELVRKYEAYRKLDDTERLRLRTLHKDLEADIGLKEVMQNYVNWLKDLDVTQRDQLRQAKTPEQKRNLVVRFRQEQLKRKADVWREMSPPPQEKRPLPAPLSGDDLKSVMTALELQLDKDGLISPAAKEVLAKIEGTQRYKLLMRSIGQYRRPKDGSNRHFDLPDAARATMLEGVQNHELKQKLLSMGRMPENRQNAQRMVFNWLRGSTLEEARREFSGSQSDALRDALFQSMSLEDQTRFSQSPPGMHDQFLSRLHFEEIWRAFSDAGDLPMRPMGDVPPGRGGQFAPFQRRPGDGRPGEGRPGDGNRPPDGNRPGDGNRPPRQP